ncbi:MAG: DUF5788 family protein [Halobacteriota archaeon]|jgi:hypothetical protein
MIRTSGITAMDPQKSAKETPNVTVWGVHLKDATTLTRKEREELLFKLNRIFTFVGTEIPEEIELDGEVIALHEVMWRLINNKRELTPEECAAVQRLWGAIERKIRQIESTIRSQDIDEREALMLYVEAQGLIRAAVELRALEKGKLFNSAQTPSTDRNEAQKRWLSYLKKIS